MILDCKLNYYKDEEGEYSKSLKSSLSDIEKIINEFWPNHRTPNDLRLILITNKNGQHLILKQVKKGVYEVFYLPKNEPFHYHGKSRIELVYQSLKYFAHSDLDSLQEQLNKTTADRKYIRETIFKSHEYQLSDEGHLKKLKWLLFGLPAGIMFLAIGIKTLTQDDISPLAIYLAPIILLAGLYIWLPGLLLHWQYYKDNEEFKIKITRGSSEINILFNGVTKNYKKSDIKKVLKVGQDKASLNTSFILYGVPWNEYGYTEVEFHSGEIINMTNLLVDQLFVLDKFKYDNIKKYKVQRTLPFIKRSTKIEA